MPKGRISFFYHNKSSKKQQENAYLKFPIVFLEFSLQDKKKIQIYVEIQDKICHVYVGRFHHSLQHSASIASTDCNFFKDCLDVISTTQMP